MNEFTPFPKIGRLFRDCTITEKIDGTNAAVCISDDGTEIWAQSRKRIITPDDDNYGFARWVAENADSLINLGPGTHFGEWWGKGIQSGYGINEKRFSLFNTLRWSDDRPEVCHVVPVLYTGIFTTEWVDYTMDVLRIDGSKASPGFMNPEGVMVYHHALNVYMKAPFKDEAKGVNG